MAQKATARLRWAVETMTIAPSDHVLEIGCGHGVAVSLVCEKLTHGTVTAIDRSQTMIDMAQKRNHAAVMVGRAGFCCVALEDAELGDARFDKVFAIRVNFFIQQPARQLAKLKTLLAPRGVLYLFYDPPIATQTAPFVETATQSLHAHGFIVTQVLEGVHGVSLVARVG